MRSKLVLAVLLTVSSLPLFAQVAPAVKINSLPLGVGGGFSDYSLDFGPGRRMFGASAWIDYRVFHGIGLEVEGTSILAGRPSALSRMRQDTGKGGVTYHTRPYFGIHPYGKALMGIGSIDFPSRNPLYTHDTYLMWAFGGGAEYRLWKNLYARGDYEYQYWHQYHGPHDLNPNGFTIGATYYLRGPHGHF